MSSQDIQMYLNGLARVFKTAADEREYPSIAELAVSGGPLDAGLGHRILDFHNARHIQPRNGRSAITKQKDEAYYRWCFSDL